MMVEYHTQQEIEPYILTVMNIVSIVSFSSLCDYLVQY